MVGHQRSRIVTAVQQPWIRRGLRFEAIARKKFATHSGRHCLEFPRDAREIPPDPGQSVSRPLVGTGIGPGASGAGTHVATTGTHYSAAFTARKPGATLHRSFTPPAVGRWDG